MVAHIHDTFYDAKATLLLEADIKEIRESRGKIPNASKKMASKFHIGPKRVYEIWDNKERLQQGVISSQPVLDENSQTGNIEQTKFEY
ncbi:4887_t:CDS:2 [Racocetra fulgida]|uniref:4887_t:CDS:1 n=1 Tax=Racocetra fulgida TaxID=60492 RepID=A0A9N9B090_9GLOM|nr:4887_t:CDS:2 [Racocetra fulgida]